MAENVKLPGYEVQSHPNLAEDEAGQKFWGRLAVDGARGFDTSEEMEKFTAMGGRVALPVSMDFSAKPNEPTLPGLPDYGKQQHVFVTGVTLPDPNDSILARFHRSFRG